MIHFGSDLIISYNARKKYPDSAGLLDEIQFFEYGNTSTAILIKKREKIGLKEMLKIVCFIYLTLAVYLIFALSTAEIR